MSLLDSHSNIVRLYDADWDDEFGYTITEYMDGGTLATHLDSVDVTTELAVGVLEEVASALAWIHENLVRSL